MNYTSDYGYELSYAHEGDAGMDLRSAEDAVILPGGRETIGTGIHIELPKGTVGYVMPRSGLAAKHGVTVLNSPGVVDEGYRGEIMATITMLVLRRLKSEKGIVLHSLLSRLTRTYFLNS
jgi:deoxyuridine 5'-triphosphate nucleotidohydrolase